MGTNVGERDNYHCYNDCVISGCPRHTLRLEFQNTSDYFTLYKDDKVVMGMDIGDMEAMLLLLVGMGDSRVEISGMLRRVTTKTNEKEE